MTLEELATYDTNKLFDLKLPITLTLTLEEMPTPYALKNLATLKKLSICTPEAILSLVGQAPIDPVNLMGTLMQIQPDGWAFSSIDFSMVRVLARTAKKAVLAALRVDIMGNTITAYTLNKANQLTPYKTLDVEPKPDMLALIQALCDDAVVAAKREGHS